MKAVFFMESYDLSYGHGQTGMGQTKKKTPTLLFKMQAA